MPKNLQANEEEQREDISIIESTWSEVEKCKRNICKKRSARVELKNNNNKARKHRIELKILQKDLEKHHDATVNHHRYANADNEKQISSLKKIRNVISTKTKELEKKALEISKSNSNKEEK